MTGSPNRSCWHFLRPSEDLPTRRGHLLLGGRRTALGLTPYKPLSKGLASDGLELALSRFARHVCRCLP